MSQGLFFAHPACGCLSFSLSLSNCLVIPCHPHPTSVRINRAGEQRVSRIQPIPSSSGLRLESHQVKMKNPLKNTILGRKDCFKLREARWWGGPSLNWGRWKKGGSRGRQELKQREPTILNYYELLGNQILKGKHKPHQIIGNLKTL